MVEGCLVLLQAAGLCMGLIPGLGGGLRVSLLSSLGKPAAFLCEGGKEKTGYKARVLQICPITGCGSTGIFVKNWLPQV